MPFQQLKLIINASDYETISEELENAGALSLTLVDAADNPIFEPEPGTMPIWDNAILTALFDLNIPLDQFKGSVEIIEDQEWQRVCQDQFQPMVFGGKLWICPSWHEIVKLDPGLAFGTGSHPTTRLCLEWLATHDLTGKILIDYGTGSGILAVAAMKLGAKAVYAVDIDTQALQAAEENAEKNNVEIKTCTPDTLAPIKADIIIANILANPLVSLSPTLLSHLKKKGYIVLSGILSTQIELVTHAYQHTVNFELPAFQEDWVRLEGVKS